MGRPRQGAFAHRNFRLFWFGLFISNTGTWMQYVAQGWLLLELTNSAFALGILALCQALPVLLLAPLGGVIADRWDPRPLLYRTQTAAMGLALVLAGLTALRAVRPWHIMILALASAAVLAVDQPARQTLLPGLVPPEDFLKAISLNAAAFNGAGFIGPALAGVVIGPLGTAACFFLNGVSFLAVLVALWRMDLVARQIAGTRSSLRAGLLEGFRHLGQSPTLLALLLLAAAFNLLQRPYGTLMPIFAKDILRVGAPGLGSLMAMPGAGTLVAAFALAVLPVARKGWLVIASNLMASAAVVLFALSQFFPASLLLLFVVGACQTSFAATVTTLLQIFAPDAVRGRIMSLYAVTFIGIGQLSGFPAGALAHFVGAPASLALEAIIGGVLCAAIAAATPQLRRL